jgi:hypothetical protein
MNIFFLSWDPRTCAWLYCDQHVNKILLEIVQMLYTTWHILQPEGLPSNAYKPISNPKHPIALWVRSGYNNYKWTARLGVALAIEFTRRFGKVHSCSKHVLWLHDNHPQGLAEVRSETAYYSSRGFPSTVTPVPECMKPEYHNPDLLRANYMNYKHEKLPFARYKVNEG